MDTSQTPQQDNQKIRAFKIWYSDHTEHGYTYADWKRCQDDDVQVVMIYFTLDDALNRPTRLYSSGADNYAMDKSMRFSSSSGDTTLEGYIKTGRYMNYKALEKLEREAFTDYGKGWLNG